MRRRVTELVPGAKVWMSTFHRFCAIAAAICSVGRAGREFHDLRHGRQPPSAARSGSRVGRRCDTHHTRAASIFDQLGQKPFDSARSLRAPSRQRGGKSRGPRVSGLPDATDVRLGSRFRRSAFARRHAALENPELRRTLDVRYRYIMVDEYQDTNLAQYTIVRALSVDHPNLAVTGDPDQSIYGWRGANLNNILEFEKDFPRVDVVRLEQNYRSTQRILRVADHLITHNRRRKPKSLFTENAEGSQVRLATYLNNRVEAESIVARIAADVQAKRRRPRDFAVFYRTNALSRNLETALRAYAIPYQMVNGLEFYQRKEIKDVLAYLHLLNNPRDRVALTRIINTPARGIGKSTIARIAEYGTRRGKSMLDAAREAGLIDGLNKRAAVAVAKFVSIFDRLSLVRSGAVEAIIAAVLEETGYRAMLRSSEDTDDQERLGERRRTSNCRPRI